MDSPSSLENISPTLSSGTLISISSITGPSPAWEGESTVDVGGNPTDEAWCVWPFTVREGGSPRIRDHLVVRGVDFHCRTSRVAAYILWRDVMFFLGTRLLRVMLL